MDFLEFSDVSAEIKGSMTPGRLKLTDQSIVFKNSKTGKVEQISSSDIELVNWQRLAGAWGLRVFLRTGALHRYGGFKDSDQDKLAKFFTQTYKKDMLEKELSVKGWNWGRAEFSGSTMSFEVGNHTAFEIPLSNVSQCTTGKNEVTLEFHQNDDASVSLMEMRLFIQSNDQGGDDAVEAFQKQVMPKASVISATGDAIAIFREVQCLTPRGRYDIKVFQSFFQLHGKTFDYKIPASTVLRLFLLPHKDGRQIFFVVSLDPPIKQGQTRYHFLVLLFNKDEETSFEIPLSEEELKEKFEGRLSRDCNGPTYEVMSTVMKAMVNRKVTIPGNFTGHSGTPAVGCSYKAAAGYLYPLERGFIYVHKPPIHIRFEEIASVNFARGGGSTRSFDFEVETKNGVVHTFSSIEKEEYNRLYDFVNNKKLRVKNTGRSDKSAHGDDFGNSDEEEAPDAYLARVKAEGKQRDAIGDDSGGDSDENDEDFKPGEESDVAEEYDSNVATTDSEASDASGGAKASSAVKTSSAVKASSAAKAGSGSGSDSDSSSKKKKKKDKKEEKEKKEKEPKKSSSSKSAAPKTPRSHKSKKDKDANRPKRPQSSYMLWLNDSREQIKKDNPGISVTDLMKKGGEMWQKVEDRSIWEAKAKVAKEAYDKAMKEYTASGGGSAVASSSSKSKDKEEKAAKSSKSSSKSSTKTPTKTPTKAAKTTPVKSPGDFKSKEYISTDEESSSASEGAKKKSKGSSKKTDKKKVEKEESEDEEMESEPESSDVADSD
ncbi:FACT complex subunit Ssrp1-like isoform X2 [Daphnia pulicaria]|uniref:FACT complex subunit Ssrp1-like isoform X2 n=1 Tax=Daphnia pulicaria TaxID=35523 RepID=UPI001EEB9C3C|nr:FACT complex subunit Ssrp1-like isoform X2 [Daphnia pulicaria]